jgi:putative zinc finger protein
MSAGTSTNDDNRRCPCTGEDLILYIYDELPDDRRALTEAHLEACRSCREEMDSFEATLQTIDRAGMVDFATVHAPGDWSELEARLEASRSAVAPLTLPFARRPGLLAKAAAILLIVGGSFVAGRYWDSIGSSLGLPGGAGDDGSLTGNPTSGGPRGIPEDSAARLRFFSEKTNGYLDRSRLVLLELANTGSAADATALRAASGNLLRENRLARTVAGQVADRRLEDLVGQLETILRQISRLSDQGDQATIDRIRAYVNNSGVLEQLEILSTAPQRVAEDRSRT